MTRDSVRLGQALQRSEPLARLRELLRDAAARFEAIRPEIPESLVAHVKAGPVDETGWSLLVTNPGVAAKLRQVQPRLEELLKQRGWLMTTIRIKVHAPGG